MARLKTSIAAMAAGLVAAGAPAAQAGDWGGHGGYRHGGWYHGGHYHHHGHGHGDSAAALGVGLIFGVLLGNALADHDRYAPPPYRYRPPYDDDYDADLAYRRPPPPRYREAVTIAERPAGPCLQAREYQTRVTVSGREVEAYGIACLQPDGSWRQGPPRLAPEF